MIDSKGSDTGRGREEDRDEIRDEGLTRGEFLRKSGSYLAAAAGALMFSRVRRAFGQDAGGGERYDLAAVVGGEPDRMFDAGIGALGGMSRFVGRGDTVLIKPNMSWHSEPEAAANTNPKLVKRIVEHCFDAGARKVYLLDHTLSRNSYQVSGIASAAAEAGGQSVPADDSRYYQEVQIRGADRLSSVEVHEMVLEADVMINVPVMKHHSSTYLTCGMKNLMGLVWNRGFYHRNDLNQCIAEFCLFRTPALTVVDAYRFMRTGGPGGRWDSDVMLKKMQIISPDIVAADTAAAAQAAMWGMYGADKIGYIDIAHSLGLGNKNLDRLSIRKIRL